MLIKIDLTRQTLYALDTSGSLQVSYLISSANSGTGEQKNSLCTPRGLHRIRAMIGAKAPANTVFVGRRPTGELWSPALQARYPGRDWILTRILWLCGCEVGRNRLGHVDTMRRYIYIHGSPDTIPMGQPRSIGCIRMRNDDIIALFEKIQLAQSTTLPLIRIEESID